MSTDFFIATDRLPPSTLQLQILWTRWANLTLSPTDAEIVMHELRSESSDSVRVARPVQLADGG